MILKRYLTIQLLSTNLKENKALTRKSCTTQRMISTSLRRPSEKKWIEWLGRLKTRIAKVIGMWRRSGVKFSWGIMICRMKKINILRSLVTRYRGHQKRIHLERKVKLCSIINPKNHLVNQWLQAQLHLFPKVINKISINNQNSLKISHRNLNALTKSLKRTAFQ